MITDTQRDSCLAINLSTISVFFIA